MMQSGSEEKKFKTKSKVAEVLKNQMDKTVVVSVKKTFVHPVFKKVIRRTTKLKAHDEQNECMVGDRVRIVETRPISKEKTWRVAQIIKRSEMATTSTEAEPTAPSKE
jgi:small subunit ribosomal protein S17